MFQIISYPIDIMIFRIFDKERRAEKLKSHYSNDTNLEESGEDKTAFKESLGILSISQTETMHLETSEIQTEPTFAEKISIPNSYMNQNQLEVTPMLNSTIPIESSENLTQSESSIQIQTQLDLLNHQSNEMNQEIKYLRNPEPHKLLPDEERHRKILRPENIHKLRSYNE